MHIPENYLSPSTCAVMAAAMLPVWTMSIKKVRDEISPSGIPLLGIGAAFCFLGMMFNVPLPGGTTGHAVGGTLLAIVMGPCAACISISIALLVQALFFGDGGVLVFGANCFNMAFVLPFAGYWFYAKIKARVHTPNGEMLAAAAGSYIGINLAALCAAIEFGIQPILFTNAAGQPLYCPYPLSLSIPAMMAGHLTLFGLAEILFTTLILGFIRKTSPSILKNKWDADAGRPLMVLMAALICLVPLGLFAQGTAWGEWGADEISSIVTNGRALGYTPSGIAGGLRLSALWPDYSMAGMPEWLGYIVSAVIGCAGLVIFFKLLASFSRRRSARTEGKA